MPDIPIWRAAVLAQVSIDDMWRLCQRHRLGRRKGRRWVIEREDLQSFFDRGLAQQRHLTYQTALPLFRWGFSGYSQPEGCLAAWFLSEIQKMYGTPVPEGAFIPNLDLDRLCERYRAEVIQPLIDAERAEWKAFLSP
mgnify:CR=1 FL=1